MGYGFFRQQIDLLKQFSGFQSFRVTDKKIVSENLTFQETRDSYQTSQMDTAPSQTQSFGQTEINWDKYVFLFPNHLFYYVFLRVSLFFMREFACSLSYVLRNSLHFKSQFVGDFLAVFHFSIMNWLRFAFLICCFPMLIITGF